MRSLRLFFVIALLFLSAATVHAAALPEQAGVVTDPVRLFDTNEAEQIAKSVQNQKVELFLLTARGLDEKEGEQLANDAYDQWKLSEDQVMLVVTVEPNYVHLVFDNQSLASLVSQSDARNAKGVIDHTFVPLAKQGKIAEGVIAVSRYLNELQEPASKEQTPTPASQPPVTATPTPQPQPTLEMEAKPTSQEPASAEVTPSSPATPDTPSAQEKSWMPTILTLLALVCLWLLGRQTLLMIQSKRLLALTRTIHAEAAPLINKTMVSELFREMEKGFIQGETMKKVAQLEQATLSLHNQSQHLQEQLEKQKVPLWSSLKFRQGLWDLYEVVQQHKQQAEQNQAQVTEMEELSIRVRQAVEHAKQRIGDMTALVEAFAQETSFSLSQKKKELEHVTQLLAKADNLDEFDFLQAEGFVTEAHQLFDQMSISMSELKDQIKLHRDFPLRIQFREEELRRIVSREQFLLTDADPFAMLQEAADEVSRMAVHLETGHSHEAKRSTQKIEDRLQHATKVVTQMIQHRDHSLETVRKIEKLLAELKPFDDVFQQEMTELKRQFAEVHIQEQSSRYADIKRSRKTLEELLIEIKAAVDPLVQQYERAHQRSKQANQLLSHIENLREQCLSYREMLEEKAWSVSNRFVEEKNLFYQSVSSYEELETEFRNMRSSITEIEIEMERLRGLLAKQHVDLYQIEEQLSTFERIVDEFAHRVQSLVREKEMTIRQCIQFQNDFLERWVFYAGEINLSRYNRQFEELQENVDRLIQLGLYADASLKLSEARSILAQMDREYQQSSRNSGGGSYNWSGGGSSSGSSSWSSSGSSSGSSSWGSSGSSSGSSSWSSSERSSGSSSWGSSGSSSGSSSWGSSDRSSGSSSWGDSSSESRSSGSSKW